MKAVFAAASLVALGLAPLVAAAPPASAAPTTQTFTTQGCGDTIPANLFTVPPGVTSVQITATGSAGQTLNGVGAPGGSGDVVSGTLSGLSGGNLDVCVGAGGGPAGAGQHANGGAGGGASGAALGSDFSTPVLVAGGGGGGAFNAQSGGGAGLPAGGAGACGSSVNCSTSASGGGGGTATQGGSAGHNNPNHCAGCTAPTAGAAFSSAGPGAGGAGGGAGTNTGGAGGGGGGGGYYGGGGGGAMDDVFAAGGGGGSDFCATSLTPPASLTGCGVTGQNSAYNTTATSVTITYTLNADLAITKTDNKASVTPGTSDTYTIVATNNGPADVSGATVIDNFPASEVTGDTWTVTYSTGASGPASGSGDINASVNLPSGGSATFTVNATISPSAIGSLSNTATVVAPASVTDPNPANNSDTDTDTLTPQAALSVTKTGPATATPGSNVTYTVTAANAGPSDAPSAAMSDALPSGTTLVSVTPPSGWTCPSPPSVAVGANGTVTCSTTAPLVVNPTGSFAIVVHVAPNFIGQLSNTATLSSSADPSSPESSGAVLTTVGCDHVLTSTRGRQTVPASGVSCGTGMSVGGALTVPAGASLVLTDSTVHSVSARGAGSITICATHMGSLRVQNSTGPVLVGDAGDDGSPGCGPNTIRGSVMLSGNTTDVELGGNTIGGSATLTNNSGTPGIETSPEVEANTINGHLKCLGNTAISNGGLPNTVTGSETGDCVGF